MSDMPRCATCKHWQKLEYPARDVYIDQYDAEQQHIEADTYMVGDGSLTWGECDAPSGPGYLGVSKLMQVWDASSYAASLTTRDIFGCVEHAAIEGA